MSRYLLPKNPSEGVFIRLIVLAFQALRFFYPLVCSFFFIFFSYVDDDNVYALLVIKLNNQGIMEYLSITSLTSAES